MKAPAPTRAEIIERTQAAIAYALSRGTHSLTAKRLCSGCGHWVDRIMFVGPKVQLCENCDPLPLPASNAH